MLNINQPNIFNPPSLAPTTDAQKPGKTNTDNKTQEATTTQTPNQASQASPEQAETLNSEDQAQTQAVESHETPANTMVFETPTQENNETAPIEPLSIQNWDDDESIYADPAISKLLEFVQDLEDKNFQQMMDMMQQSLDRAREMMEQSQERWINVDLPKKQAMESSMQEIDATQSALNQITADNAAIRQQGMNIDSAISKIESQVQSSPGLVEDNDAHLLNLLSAMKQVIQSASNN